MAQIRISDAAAFLAVSPDTVRRLITSGKLERGADEARRTTVDGRSLAQYARTELVAIEDHAPIGRSARNRFVGIITEVIADTVMAQVEIQCGPHRIVSLISAESVRELGLDVGVVATAVIKSTNVLLETTNGE